MTVPFATSARSSVGLEWELMLADRETGDLVGRAPEVLAALEERTALERYTVTGELLTNTIEVTSGIGDTVAAAVDDIADAIAAVRTVTNPLEIELLCAGSHPFAQWYDQQVTDKTRYHTLIERTQWWGRNMMIWGIHVHVGVEDVNKVFPIINALSDVPAAPAGAVGVEPVLGGRAHRLRVEPRAGLPAAAHRGAALAARGLVASSRATSTTWSRTGVMADATEVRWDIRPAPRWGTIEVRACDGMSTLPELAAVAALVQVLVEHFSRELDEGRELPVDPAVVRAREQVARRPLRPRRRGHRRQRRHAAAGPRAPARDDGAARDVAVDLHCAREFAGLETILTQGASYARQLRVADAADGDLREVVHHLIREFRAGPTLREHLAALGH